MHTEDVVYKRDSAHKFVDDESEEFKANGQLTATLDLAQHTAPLAEPETQCAPLREEAEAPTKDHTDACPESTERAAAEAVEITEKPVEAAAGLAEPQPVERDGREEAPFTHQEDVHEEAKVYPEAA